MRLTKPCVLALILTFIFLISARADIQDKKDEIQEGLLSSSDMLRKWSDEKFVTFGIGIYIDAVRWKKPDGKEETIYARTWAQIQEDIEILNRDFEPAKMRFAVRRANLRISEYQYDAKTTLAHKAIAESDQGNHIAKLLGRPMSCPDFADTIDINFMFGIGIGLGGLAEVKHSAGGQIWIFGSSEISQVVSHEVGHYFGLKHTFDSDDDVLDTPTGPNISILYGTESDPNRNNIMSYSQEECRVFTIGQIDRMRRHAAAWRHKDRWSDLDHDDKFKIDPFQIMGSL